MTINWKKEIDKFIAADREARRGKHTPLNPNEFYASSMTGCVRQSTKQRLGLAKYPAHALRSMMVGTILHAWLQSINKEPHMEYEKQTRLELPPYTIIGRIDAYDGETVYDFKTINGLKYAVNKSEKDELSYQMQLSVYAHALNCGARIVYVDKSSLATHEKHIKVLPKEELLNFCHKITAAIEEYRKTGELPPKCGCFSCKSEGHEKMHIVR